MKPYVVISCLIAITLPSMIWCIQRYADHSDDPLGVIALIALVGILFLRNRQDSVSMSASKLVPAPEPTLAPQNEQLTDSDAEPGQENLPVPPLILLLLVIYTLTIIYSSRTFQLIAALTLVGAAAQACLRRNKFVLGDWMLLYMALPVVASLNFYLGYPLRSFVAQASGWLLNLQGFHVAAQGTLLTWNDHLTEVDAPCSGLKMLWFATFLAATFSAFFKLRPWKAIVLMTFAAVGALAANIQRVTSLFFIENGIIHIPGGESYHALIHQSVGASIFLLLCAFITCAAFYLAKPGDGDRAAATRASFDEIKPIAKSSPLLVWLSQPKIFYALCAINLLLRLISFQHEVVAPASSQAFTSWPATFEGKPIERLPDAEILKEFGKDFPGKIAVFSDGTQIICMRWISHETRQLHPSSDCYRGLGYKISQEPSTTDANGNRWNNFTACKDSKRLQIRERLFDLHGHSWNDVSAWYWSAVTQQSTPPWWSITVSAQ